MYRSWLYVTTQTETFGCWAPSVMRHRSGWRGRGGCASCPSGHADPQPLAGVPSREDAGPPRPVVEVPANGPPQARLEGLGGAPAELGADARRVDRVAQVVAGSVDDV